MGSLGEAMGAYVQPLIDACDGSAEEMNKAFTIGQVCWNLAVSPENMHKELLADMQPVLKMTDAAFEEFLDVLIFPMIRRHHEMFPRMHDKSGASLPRGASMREMGAPAWKQNEAFSGTPRNAPCPCNSGKKYKRCCGRMD